MTEENTKPAEETSTTTEPDDFFSAEEHENYKGWKAQKLNSGAKYEK